MNFEHYQSQIKDLITLRNEPDFNELFNKILFGESTSDKFLIKMELTRLAKPCQRIIDLRDKTVAECQLFQYEGINHYLTTTSIKTFKEKIKLYGHYSIGVFEAVTSHAALQKEKNSKKINFNEAPQNELQCELLHLSQQAKHFAPRMFFVSNIEIFLDTGERVSAQTSNISTSGLKIKLSDDIELNNQQDLQISFTDLRQQYVEPILDERITYRVVKHSVEDEMQYLYLTDIEQQPQFISFVRDFIRSNQYRYKIDVQYYYQVAKTTALKNMYIAQMSPLPVYLNSKSSTPFLFALNNKSNEKLIADWRCEEENQLPILFNELRLARLIAHAATKENTTLYTFTYNTNGKEYFLSASEEELVDKGLKELFLNFGSNKPSWRVYHFTLTPYQYQESGDYDITEPIPPKFVEITHIATLQQTIQPLFHAQKKINKAQLNNLNQFVHNDDSDEDTVIFTLFSNEHRKEERYLHKSRLTVATEGADYTGQLIDFSLSGLKIKLDQIASISVADKVNVNLVELQKVSKKFPLSHLHYKVVSTSKNNTLHLQVCDSHTLEICTQFFSLVIKNNHKRLQCMPLQSLKQPPSKRLLEVSEAAFNDCVFFVNKEVGRPKIKIAAIDKVDHPLKKLFLMRSDNNYQLNYFPLVSNHLYERLLAQPFKKGDVDNIYKEELIYVKANRGKDGNWMISSFLESDFNSRSQAIEFIVRTDSAPNTYFYALHYRFRPLETVDLHVIQKEIHAISRFATHLTKKLEDELLAINAMIELTDRTQIIIDAASTHD